MKKTIFILILFLIMIFFITYKINNKGDIKGAEILIGESHIYSESDIKKAMDVVLKKFKMRVPAKLIKIWYDETINEREYNLLKERYDLNYQNFIVICTSFKTNRNIGSNTGYDSEYMYSDVHWTLTKDLNGNWVFIDY